MEANKLKLSAIAVIGLLVLAAGSFLFDKREGEALSLLAEISKESATTSEAAPNLKNNGGAEEGEAEVVKDPWLNGYSYRKPVTITNSTSTLSNYQVPINIDSATLVSNSKLQSDCDDLRFTTADGYTLMDYWIESGCNTATTTIWTEIPSIANGTSTIYIYYGNASSTAASSGANTFLFFDDFPGTTIDAGKWNSYASNATIAVGSGYVRMYGSSGNTRKSRIYSLTTFGNNVAMRYRYYLENSYWAQIWITIATTADAAPSVTGVYEVGGTRNYRASTSSSFNVYNNGTQLRGISVTNPAGTTWYTEELKLGTGYQQATRADVNLSNYNGDMSSTQTYRCWFGEVSAWDTAMGLRVDWVGVRNYVSTEPSAVLGSEVQLITQAGTGAANWTWKAPAAGDYIKNGTSTNWVWTEWHDDSTGVIVPYSTSTDWTWYPQ
jgi:hypothetical protein